MDEMSLKSNLHYDIRSDRIIGYEDFGVQNDDRDKMATSALVFMVRGIARNWKQPITYYFTASTCKANQIHNLLLDCLNNLHDIGLTVKGVISDQGSNFLQLSNTLGITPEKPYFVHSSRKYYYLFDPPHLLKSVRNNLFKHNIFFDNGKQASWQDIRDFYSLDSKQNFKLTPQLTTKHIELPAFTKMKVKLASQVLSHSVAAGLETHAALFGSTCTDTAEFVKTFDNLFDAVNSSQRKCQKPLKCAITEHSDHMSFLQATLEWIGTLSIRDEAGKDITNNIKCIKGWKISISAIMQLWTDLRTNHGLDFLLTRRLNQDSVENMFSEVRQRGGNNDSSL